MDVTDYIEKGERLLNNKEHYRQLSKCQTAANNETVKNVIKQFRKENVVTKNAPEELKTTLPWASRFYIQPLRFFKTSNPLRSFKNPQDQ